MRVSSSPETTNRSESTGSKSVVKKKAKNAKDKEETGAAAADVKLSEKAKSAKETKETKAKEPKRVLASKPISEAPPKSESQELSEAETLMTHVDSGKLSDDEREMALKRIGDVLKKYGRA